MSRTSIIPPDRLTQLRARLVAALQSAAAVALDLGEVNTSRYLSRLADIQFSQLPEVARAPFDSRFDHDDERRQ